MLKFHRPHVDFTETGTDRAHFRRCIIGQGCSGLHQAFINLRPRKVDIYIVVKNCRDLRKAVARQRAGVAQTGNTGQRRFYRKCHLLLDIFR
jgi:hypothetical protein